MIDLASKHLAVVQSILKKFIPDREVRIFGSRVTGAAKKYSDIDLVIMGKERVGRLVLAKLELAFQESDLPYRVDLVEWATTNESFQQIILANCEVIVMPGQIKPRAS